MLRPQTIARLYEALLRGVLAGKGPFEAEDYLRRIGERSDELRLGYRAAQVRINYSDREVVDAYLIRYYPHYTHTASVALNRIACTELRRFTAMPLRVLLIGGGPEPELIALVDRLLECDATPRQLDVTVLDAGANAWAPAVAQSEALARGLAPGLRLGIRLRQGDVCRLLDPEQSEHLGQYDLVFVQNCLNEVSGGLDVEAFHGLLLSVLAPVGFLVISDFTEYDATCKTVAAHEALLRRDGLIALATFQPGQPRVESPFWRVPPRLYYGFFGATRNEEGQLVPVRWPRRWLRFSNSVWKRPA